MSEPSTPFDPDMPLPIVQVDPDEVWSKHSKGDGRADPETPLGAAIIWQDALRDPTEYRDVLEALSYNPIAWDGFREAAAQIAHLSALTPPRDNIDRHDIKYVIFINFAGEAGEVIGEAPIEDYWVVTMVRPEGSPTWLVWGTSHGRFPPTEQVLVTES